MRRTFWKNKKPSSLRRGLLRSNFSSPYLSDPDESVGISTFALNYAGCRAS